MKWTYLLGENLLRSLSNFGVHAGATDLAQELNYCDFRAQSAPDRSLLSSVQYQPREKKSIYHFQTDNTSTNNNHFLGDLLERAWLKRFVSASCKKTSLESTYRTTGATNEELNQGNQGFMKKTYRAPVLVIILSSSISNPGNGVDSLPVAMMKFLACRVRSPPSIRLTLT